MLRWRDCGSEGIEDLDPEMDTPPRTERLESTWNVGAICYVSVYSGSGS